MHHAIRSLLGLTALALFFLLPGCSPRITRVSIEGKVTYQGKALEGGEVTFRPAAGPGCGADIAADGTFTVPRSFGPMPGRCLVTVEQFGEVSETGTDGRTTSRRQSILPAIYREKARAITLVKGHNRIALDLDAWESP